MNTAQLGVTSPQGFLAVGAHIGIKKKNKDLALLWSTVPAKVAAVFTTNVVKAAPIIWNQQILAENSQVQGIVINSGNANACTGKMGFIHTQEMAQKFAECRGVNANQILVASTGIIGLPLPIDCIKKGIENIHVQLSSEKSAGTAAAEAIKTTDSFSKEFSISVQIGDKAVTIGGMAKGSGMIHPNMATMLAFITTDANISISLLQDCFRTSVQQTYNMISVDGDTSTNDMAVILANGLAGNKQISDKNSDDYQIFLTALNTVNTHLAKAIVNDGEGATKFLEVLVQGADSLDDAQKLSKAVISSSLVKTAFFVQDANWGRILAALGYGGVSFDPSRVSIQFMSDGGNMSLINYGEPAIIDETNAANILKERNIKVLINMNSGKSSATAWGCDLSHEYIRITGNYRR